MSGDPPGPPARRRRLSGPRRPNETLLQRLERVGDAYGLVLLLVLTTFVVTMTLPPTGWGGRTAAVAVACLTAIFGLTSSDVRIERVRLAVIVSVVLVVLAALAKAVDSRALLGLAFLGAAILLAIAAFTILGRVILALEVNFRTILGAVSVYTSFGLLFGFLFMALGRLKGDNVFSGVAVATTRDYLFFSYTTLTTTGYGNLVPKGTIGEILTVLEMLTGQIFLVTLVAGLVSLWRPGRAAGAEGSAPGSREA